MLKVSNLTLSFESAPVVRDVSLQVQRGEVVSLIGPNGAGKSTILKGIMNIAGGMQISGSVIFKDKAITEMKTKAIVGLGISYIPQGNTVFNSLTVEENLKILCALSRNTGLSVSDRMATIYQAFPFLREYRSKRASLLSGGERQALGLARVLTISPALLLLDEPSIGLSPKLAAEVFNLISTLRAQGTSILLVEQRIKEAIALSDRVYILKSGMMFFEGTRNEVFMSDWLEKAYLGG